MTGCDHANRIAAEADVVLAVGTRLQDFTTGSWTVFGDATRLIGLNAARFDAVKHRSLPLQGDAREDAARAGRRARRYRAPAAWSERGASTEAAAYRAFVAGRTAPGGAATYAQVVGAVNRLASRTTTSWRRRAASRAS